MEIRNIDNAINASLVLEDGTIFHGKSFGANTSCEGEVIFNTGMVGYPETLTDPSYNGQILILTYPLIGNYGIPNIEVEYGLEKNFESSKIQVQGLIISDYSFEFDHWNSKKSLSKWLIENNVPAIYGIDTRELTQKIREHGVMKGKIIINSNPNKIELKNLVEKVSIKEKIEYKRGENKEEETKILLIDCGVKNNIIRELLKRNITVIRVPYNYNYNFSNEEYDGILISNGPGDPKDCIETINNLKEAIKHEKPIFGICLGNQLLALASGADTYKLKYGHRSQNQPCMEVNTNNCYITSQNHGYAINETTLKEDWEPWFRNINDNTNEGIKHKTKPFFAVQFHPEAAPGPNDTSFLFDYFIDIVKKRKEYSKEIFKEENFDKTSIKKVLILGSGGLKIGQAGEFDYSGSQAIKALKEEEIYTIVINPNIATVQTSEGMANKTYFLPINPEFIEKVIMKEKPDSILLSFGGQTALNCGIELAKLGILEKYNIKVLGTSIQTIHDTEDRDLFVKKLNEINVKTPKSIATYSTIQSMEAAKTIGYPLMIRAAYALGGLGSGLCKNEEELIRRCTEIFSVSPQILIEEWLGGWKEIEYEVVRDRYNNCITVCNMENFDPLGIHTGESIVVAPSQTLNNSEYQKLRDISIKVIRHLNIVGECNIQFALDPNSEDYRVIEVNARLSRSSALASKATGYPLAFIAAKIAVGYSLKDIENKITKTTKTFFEPALDYIVIKIPRWDLQKFKNTNKKIGSEMKSVGEVMSIGRTFEEALQKALRMTGIGVSGLTGHNFKFENLEEELINPTDKRIFAIVEAIKTNISIEKIHEYTKINKWFLYKLKNIIDFEKQFSEKEINKDNLTTAKKLGFEDSHLAKIKNINEKDIRNYRENYNIKPCIKQIDTLAAEYPALTNYLYLTYNGNKTDILPNKDNIFILGSGAYRIGSSVEFDWCCVNSALTAQNLGYKTIMLNFNPETVSTDYDICDKLYFDEISFERINDIYDFEKPKGIIVSMGGQTPNNLAIRLYNSGLKILGTHAENIDIAEDRHKFSKLLDKLKVDQPEWKELTSITEAKLFANKVTYPVLIRPSYVLSGAAMSVAWDDESLVGYLDNASQINPQHPVVITKFIEDAKEIEIDAVAKNGELIIYAISEHIEKAGIHSGDASIVLPAQKIYIETIKQIKSITKNIAKELNITGPFNIQFIAKDNKVKVIECNLRASRSFPFCSKIYKKNMIELATKAILDMDLKPVERSVFDLDYIGIKVAQFSFSRLKGTDPILGVEMASTGEVACLSHESHDALLKGMISANFKMPKKNILLSTGPIKNKVKFLESTKKLIDMGYTIYASEGTAKFLQQNNIPIEMVNWPLENKKPNIRDLILEKQLDLIINIPKNNYKTELKNDYIIRRMAIDHDIPLITNIEIAIELVNALEHNKKHDFEILSWDEY